jgi:SAM-dependent methyltransferase
VATQFDNPPQPPLPVLQERLSPSIAALIPQLVALPLTISFYAWLAARAGPSAAAWIGAGVQGVTAAVGSWLVRQANWWQAIHLLFPLAVLVGLMLEIPPAWYLAAFALLAGVYWGVHRTQVPLYLSSRRAVEAVGKVLPDKAGLRFLDAGCGTGGLLLKLADRRPDAIFEGVEIAPLPYLVARFRASTMGRRNAVVRARSLWDVDLAEYDVVYAYLSPAPMARLWHKAKREMRPGSLFISNSFAVPGVPPHEVIPLNDLNSSALHLWRM